MTSHATPRQACERCWKRKQKCDKDIPICSHCHIAGTECKQRRVGFSWSSSEPAAPSYIEALKRRVHMLEEVQSGRITSGASYEPPTSQAYASDILEESVNQEDKAASSSVRTAIRRLEVLPLNAMAEQGADPSGDMRDTSNTPAFSFSSVVQAALSVGGSNPTDSSSTDDTCQTIGKFYDAIKTDGLVLSRALAEHPIRCYLSFADAFFPYLGHRNVLEDYYIIADKLSKDTTRQSLDNQPGDVVCVCMAIAIGLLLQPKYRYKEPVILYYIRQAHQKMPDVLAKESDTMIVKCLVSLALGSIYSSRAGSTWHLIGLAITKCIAAGLHTIEGSDCESDNETKRLNSDLFWTVYVLDTVVCTAYGRPYSIHDHEITAPKPRLLSGESNTHNCDILHHISQYALLLRSHSKSTYVECSYYHGNCQHWKNTLPRTAVDTTASLRMRLQQDYRNGMYVSLLAHSMLQSSNSAFSNDLFCSEFLQLSEQYLGSLHEKVCGEGSALSALEAVNVFLAGIIAVAIRRFKTTDSMLPFLGISVREEPSIMRVLDILMTSGDAFTGTKPLFSLFITFIDLMSATQLSADHKVKLMNECLSSHPIELPRRTRKFLLETIDRTENRPTD